MTAKPAIDASSRPGPARRLVWLLAVMLGLAGIPLGMLAGCQSRLLYMPRSYRQGVTQQWAEQTRGRTVDFKTSQGNQRAFLQGNLNNPRNLWIVCGGNGSVALDWARWLQHHAPREDACLLVDFPGYGDCQGEPSPGNIRESFQVGVPLACESLGWGDKPAPERLRIFGHSLGAAASLIAASEFGIRRGVLLAPFTSTMDMTRQVTGLPLGFLVWHRFDNEARLAEIEARGPGEVVVFHGTSDHVIPVSMSRSLAAGHPRLVRFIEIPDGDHNSLHGLRAAEVAEAMRQTGR